MVKYLYNLNMTHITPRSTMSLKSRYILHFLLYVQQQKDYKVLLWLTSNYYNKLKKSFYWYTGYQYLTWSNI